YISTTPVGQGQGRADSENFHGINFGGMHRALMGPIVAEVKYELKFIAEVHRSKDFGRGDVQRQNNWTPYGFRKFFVRVETGDASAVGQGELVEMGPIPAREGGVNGIGKVLKSVCGTDCEYSARPWPQFCATTAEEFYFDG